jgi:ABC-type sugar transport system substrate-binding protein
MSNKISVYLLLTLALVLGITLVACQPAAEEPAAEEPAAEEPTEEAATEEPTEEPAAEEPAEEAATEEPTEEPAAEESYLIGVSAQLVAHDWSIKGWEGIQEKAAELGVEVVQLSAGQDPDKQLADIESLIEQGADGIIILLAETGVLDQAIQKTTEAGIPVVFMDGGYQADGVIQNISSDNCQFGQDAAEYIVQQKGEDAQVILQTYPVLEATNQRTICAMEYWDENYPDVTILEEQPILGPEWTADAQAHAEQMITKYGEEIDAFGVCSDLFAIGSSAAVDTAGLSDQIMVTGVDGLEQIIEKIADPNSSMSLTFLQDSAEMGRVAVQSLVTYLDAGCSVPMSAECEGVVEPVVFVPGIMITKENANEYISE